MKRDFEYEKNNIAYDEQYPEGGIKCKNYELCGAVLPEWWFECKCSYLCTNCDMLYLGSTLEIKDNLECVICFEIKRSVTLRIRANKKSCFFIYRYLSKL